MELLDQTKWVLFVEGDGGTDVNALNGIGNTQGDWVTGTPILF